jgi:molybdopterin biosynthesis enzyme
MVITVSPAVALSEAYGRVLFDNMRTPRTVPPLTKSAMKTGL